MRRHFYPVIILVVLLFALPGNSMSRLSAAENMRITTYANGNDIRILVRQGNFLWAGTKGGGAIRWDPSNGTFTQFLYPQDGLPGNDVRDIAVDGQGGLWFATNHGLGYLAADGMTWTTYSRATTQGRLPSDDVKAVAIAPDGSVWVATAQYWDEASQGWTGGGIARFDGTYWRVFVYGYDPMTKRFTGLPSNNASDLAVEPGTGRIWATFIPQYIWIPPADQHPGQWVLDITSGGAAVFDGSNWTIYQRQASNPASLPSHNTIMAVAIDSEGRKWFATWGGGLNVLYGSSGAKFTQTTDGLPSNYLYTVAAGPDGRIWVGLGDGAGGQGRGAAVLDYATTINYPSDDTWTRYTTDDGLAGSEVQAILPEDSAIWFGTADYAGNGRGLSRLDVVSGAWSTLSTTTGTLVSNQISALAFGADGTAWLGTGNLTGFGRGRGLSRFTLDGNWASFDLWSIGEQIGTVQASTTAGARLVAVDFKSCVAGTIKFASHSTLYKCKAYYSSLKSILIDPALAQTIPPGEPVNAVNLNLGSNNVSDIAVDGQGRVWVGLRSETWNNGWVDGGLSVYANGTWTTYRQDSSGLVSNNVSAVAVEPAACGGRVWVGTGSLRDFSGSGLSIFDPTARIWTTHTVNNGLPSNDITDIAIDPQTCKVWVATAPYRIIDPFSHSEVRGGGGAAMFDGTRWFKFTSTNSDLKTPDNDIRSVAIDSHGHAWFGTWVYSGNCLSCDAPYMDAAVFRYDGTTWQKWVFPREGWVSALAIDPAGRVWAGTSQGDPDPDLRSGGLRFFDGVTWSTRIGYTDGLVAEDIHAIAVDPNGLVWVGTNAGVSRVQMIDLTPTPSMTLTPNPTDTPTATATPTETPTVEPSATPSATVTPTSSPTDTATPSPSATHTWSPTETATPGWQPTETASPSSTSSPTPTWTSSPQPAESPSPTGTASLTATWTPSPQPTTSPSPTATPTSTTDPTWTPSATAINSPTPTNSPEPTSTPSPVWQWLAAQRVALPSIQSPDGWNTQIRVQNAGITSIQVVADLYALSSGECPANADTLIRTFCSGPLPPGQVWSIDSSQLPAQAASALIYSTIANPEDTACQPDSRIASGQPIAVTVSRKPATGEGNTYTGLTAWGNPDSSGRYSYLLPPLTIDPNQWTTDLAVQNAGAECTQVNISYLPANMSQQALDAGSHGIAPGQSANFDPATMIGAQFNNSTSVIGDQPLAIIVNQWATDKGTLRSAPALPGSFRSQASGAPLLYHTSGDARVLVQNTSSDIAGGVRVTFFDAAGQIIAQSDHWIDPAQSEAVPIPAGSGGGAVRVESLAGRTYYRIGSTADLAPFILSWIELSGSATAQKARYVGIPLDQGSQSIALPSLVKSADRTSLIIVHNLNSAPGPTEARFSFFGPDGSVTAYQVTLSSSQTAVLDVGKIVPWPEGWVGSGMIRVGRFAQAGTPELTAIVMEQTGTPPGKATFVYQGIAVPEAIAPQATPTPTRRDYALYLPLIQRPRLEGHPSEVQRRPTPTRAP